MVPLKAEEIATLPKPRAIRWTLTDAVRNAIAESEAEADAISNDLSITLLKFDAFSRSDLKARRVSPDTAVQMVRTIVLNIFSLRYFFC